MSRAGRDRVDARWSTAVLVCGKCSRRQGGGFGDKGRTPLAKLLRSLAGGKGRKAAFGVVETGCLKLCPKRAVVAIDARQAGTWRLIPPGMAPDAILAALNLSPAAPAGIEPGRCALPAGTPIGEPQVLLTERRVPWP